MNCRVYIDPSSPPTFVFSEVFFSFFIFPRALSVKKKEGQKIHQYAGDIVLAFQKLVLMCCSGLL